MLPPTMPKQPISPCSRSTTFIEPARPPQTPEVQPLTLTGRDLTPAGVADVARAGRQVEISGDAQARMHAARAALEQALADGRQMYGLTTGLGARVDEPMPDEDPAELSV